MPEPTLLSARAARQQHIITVDLGDGTCVRARKADLTGMLFEGIVPTPLMQAAQKFIDNRDMKPADRLADLEDDDDIDKVEMLAVLRQHAVTVVIQPVIVLEDDGDPDHLPVALFTLQQLLAIWNQTAVLPKVGAADAATFRLHERPIAAVMPRARENLRPAPEPLRGDVERKGA